MPSAPRNELEQQLRESEERYRLTFEHARIGIAIAGPDRRFIRANRRFCEIVGYSAEELLGRTFADISHPEDRQMALEWFGRLSRGESDFEEYDRRYIRKDGGQVWAHVALSAAREAGGSIACVVGVVEDVSGQRAAMDEIRAARLKQSGLARLGAIALSNAGLGFLFSRSAEVVREVLGLDFAEVGKDDEGRLLVVGQAGDRPASEAAGILSRRTLAADVAVLVQDAAGEMYEVQPDQEPGLIRGVSMVIEAGQQRWGVLAAHTSEPRHLTAGDIDFLRTLAALLGQTIERRRAEVEARIRAVQQSAIAEIARLTALDVTQPALERACELLMEGLGVEYAAVLRPAPGGETFEVAAGEGRFGGLPLRGSHAGEAFARLAASVVEFDEGPPGPGLPAGVRTGVAAPISNQQRFGVLCAYTSLPKTFTGGDVQFMESVARVIAESMERQAARAELIESEQRYRSVVEGASEIIFSVTPGGKIISLNPAFEAVTGWQMDELIGRHFGSLLAGDQRERVLEIFGSVLTEPRHIRVQVPVRGRTRTVLLDVATSPKVVDGEVVALHGFARDITEERRLARSLEQVNRLSSLGRLAATVAHEFNNVLMGISPFAELLRREHHSERAATAIDQISRAVKRGKRITEDILRFAQPAEPVMVPLDVPVWLGALALETQSLIGPACEVRIESAENLRVAADPHQLHQAFVNLILNARDAMPQGGAISIRAARENPAARFAFGAVVEPERYAHFIVEDSGSGIPPETLDHIFEPLFTTKKTGTGLGLPVARQVVARHGGEMFVESTAGEGTRFHLFIPLAGHEESLPAAEALPISSRCRRVLLVEDDEPVASGLAALLEGEGMEVEIVGTGAAVLPAVARSRPDAVVLDIGLPDMDGTIVFAALSQSDPDLPVVFSSGHGDATKLERYMARGNVGFLLKPYDLDALLQVLDRVLPS